MRILVTIPEGPVKETFIPPQVAEIIRDMGEATWNETCVQFSPKELRDKLVNTEVCITGWGCPRLDEYVLENASDLKLVAHTGGTVAPIVSDYLYSKGIKVISGNQIYAESVAEGVLAYMLSSLRDIPYFNSEVQNGRWKAEKYHNEGLLDQSVGLVGFGMVAKFLVELLRPFRVKIKAYGKPADEAAMYEYGVEKASLEEIFSSCRIISLHVPKKPDTYHMIDKRLLGMISEGSLLVNTARGSVIDEAAMEEELQKGRFKAVLDVFETEPLTPESKLRDLQNVILIPHMAGPTIDRRKYVTLGLIKDIKQYNKGERLAYEISREYAAFMTE